MAKFCPIWSPWQGVLLQKININCLHHFNDIAPLHKDSTEYLAPHILVICLSRSTRLDQTILDQTRLDQTILDQTTLDQTRLDKTWPSQIRLDQTKLDQTRLDQTRLDQTRLDQTRLDQTRLDQTRLDQTRLDQTSVKVMHSQTISNPYLGLRYQFCETQFLKFYYSNILS